MRAQVLLIDEIHGFNGDDRVADHAGGDLLDGLRGRDDLPIAGPSTGCER